MNNDVLSILVLVTLLFILLIIMTVVACILYRKNVIGLLPTLLMLSMTYISVTLHSFYFIKQAIIVATESSHLQTPYELVGDCELTEDESD